MTDDVLIVGGGPAGAVAGLVLARAGARVRIVDRSAFPRDKLCGDTVNPGTLAHLRRLGVSREIDACGLAVAGMVVTSRQGVAITGRYPRELEGRALLRRDLDWLLLKSAIDAGCRFDARVVVRGAIVDCAAGRETVRGVNTGAATSLADLCATVTIAADGRHSTLAFGLGLARHPDRPRRWAIGGYFSEFGELANWRIGESANQCLDNSPTHQFTNSPTHQFLARCTCARTATSAWRRCRMG